jgi:hypothetical protein
MAIQVDVYLETAAKRTFAGALDWPGWCRHGRTEAEALAALLEYAPRYAAILEGTGLAFAAPSDPAQIVVVERLEGTSTTDFGAPAVPPATDEDRSCDRAELERFGKILRAGWRAFDEAVEAARGKELSKGPRGGGRTLEAIVEHVIGSDESYLRSVGWKPPEAAAAVEPTERLTGVRDAILAALEASAAGELPERGPRGGVRWTARYFVRRVAWHVIAHAWEIERRAA